MTTNGKVVLAVLIGAAAGAALGLLFAPESGETTRRRIADGVGGLGKKITGRGGDINEEMEDIYDDIKTNVRSKVTRNV